VNKFEYELKATEMERLTTKVSKTRFIKALQIGWNLEDALTIKLVAKILTDWRDQGITGVASLLPFYNHAARAAPIEYFDHGIETFKVPAYLYTATWHQATRSYMANSSIPYWIKLAIRKEAETRGIDFR